MIDQKQAPAEQQRVIVIGPGEGEDLSRRPDSLAHGQIVEPHDGEIRAEFPEDGGTRLIVTLPRDGDSEQMVRGAPGAASARARILRRTSCAT